MRVRLPPWALGDNYGNSQERNVDRRSGMVETPSEIRQASILAQTSKGRTEIDSEGNKRLSSCGEIG